MPNGTTQDVRIAPPPKITSYNTGFWGYLVDESGKRILYWDKDHQIPDRSVRTLFVEYELKDVSLYIIEKMDGEKIERMAGTIQIAIITHFDKKT